MGIEIQQKHDLKSFSVTIYYIDPSTQKQKITAYNFYDTIQTVAREKALKAFHQSDRSRMGSIKHLHVSTIKEGGNKCRNKKSQKRIISGHGF